MPRTSDHFTVRVVTSTDLTCATVRVAAAGKIDDKSLAQLENWIGAVAEFSFSQVVIDLTDLELLPVAGAQLLASFTHKVKHQNPTDIEILCRPRSMTARTLESVGITPARP